MNTIYALVHPRSPDRIRYVGVTSQPLLRRLGSHLSHSRQGAPYPVNRWIRKMLADGFQPLILPLEATEDRRREAHWIAHYLSVGMPLLNCAEATGEVATYTSERRERISLFHKTRPRTPMSEETKRKISQKIKGRSVDEATKARISQGLKGKPKSAEHRAKVIAWNTGRTRSVESRANMSASAKLRPPPPPPPRRTHCHKGHPFILQASGRQVCPECRREIAKAHYYRKKNADSL